MPRPGYEPEEDFDREDDDKLLARFPAGAQDAIRAGLEEGSIGWAHVLQLYRLQTRMPEMRDDDAVEDLVEMAARMSADELKDWVDEHVDRAEDM